MLAIDALGLFEVNPDIELMALHSHAIFWDDPRSDGGSDWRKHTPTLTMRRRDGLVCVLDVRTADEADTDEWRRTEAFLKIDYGRLNASFATLTDETVYVEPRRHNVVQMLQMRMTQRDHSAIDRVRVVVNSVAMPTTVGKIIGLANLPNPHGCADPALVCLVELALAGEIELDLSRPLGVETCVSFRGRGSSRLGRAS